MTPRMGRTILGEHGDPSNTEGPCMTVESEPCFMLDVQATKDCRVALPYAHRVRVEWKLESALTRAGEVRARFKNHQLTIRGVRLEPLLEGLAFGTVRQIRRAEPGAGLRDKTSPLVYEISVIPKP